MTRKHFIALADAFKLSKPDKDMPQAFLQWAFDRSEIADVCEASNPRFNRQHWFDYIDGKVPAIGRRPKNQ